MDYKKYKRKQKKEISVTEQIKRNDLIALANKIKKTNKYIKDVKIIFDSMKIIIFYENSEYDIKSLKLINYTEMWGFLEVLEKWDPNDDDYKSNSDPIVSDEYWRQTGAIEEEKEVLSRLNEFYDRFGEWFK